MTGDAQAGAIVEARTYEDDKGRDRLSLAARSDITLEAQVAASGATWLDRQLLSRDAMPGSGFGAEVQDAMDRGSIISLLRGWLDAKASKLSLLAICSARFDGESSTRRHPSFRLKPD